MMGKTKKPDKENIEDILALTPMQEGMLFHYINNPSGTHYFEQLSLNISGEVDAHRFEQAWNVVVETNPALRTMFRWKKTGMPVQIILKHHVLKSVYQDFSGEHLSDSQRRSLLKEAKVKDRDETFDLRNVPFRVTLCKLSRNEYDMIISNHHILYDGWSTGLILKEFFDAYNALTGGTEPARPVKTHFKKFIESIRNRDKVSDRVFWQEYLGGYDTRIELPVKKSNGEKIGEIETHRTVFPKKITGGLNVISKKHRVSIAAVLYSVWGILLQRYGNSEDVVLGTTVSGRSAKIEGIENAVGLFINTLPLRVRTRREEKIDTLLSRTNRALQAREEHENTPLTDINQYSELSGNEELFDSIVAIENYPLDSRLKTGIGGLTIESYSMREGTHYDLTVGITVFNDIEITFSYYKNSFAADFIQRLSGHFGRILREIIENPTKEIRDIDILSAEEKRRLLIDFNDTAADYPRDKTVHRLFEEQAARTGDRTAILGKSIREDVHIDVHITYKEVNKKSSQTAFLLAEKGIKPGSIVGIMMNRSIEMVIGILGIMKAGGAYLPIDPNYPQERIRFMLADSNAKILIKDSWIKDSWIKNSCRDAVGSQNLAYIIYTSGSTGNAKGVMVEHRSLVNLLAWFAGKYNVKIGTHVIQMTRNTFDPSINQIFSTLLYGAVLFLAPENLSLDRDAFYRFVDKNQIYMINFAPTGLKELLCNNNRLLKSLRLVISGGDTLEESIKGQLIDAGYELYNQYGPTEATIDTLVERCTEAPVTLGTPIANFKCYIIGIFSHLAPVGVAGELCISGEGVARGYLNNPALTQEKFTDNPFEKGERMYRSGDMTRRLPDGKIEFLGRIDHQVKIRGFRIELGEIEGRLLAHEAVKEAVVAAGKTAYGDTYLCAYIVGGETAELRSYLSSTLPDYMVPSYFVQIEKVPLTATGKIDRKALPLLEPGSIPAKRYTAPRDREEERLVEIWSGVLEVEKESIGIDDNFFELGGHSLKATRLTARIHKAFDIDIPISVLFKAPTVRGLHRYMKDAAIRRHHFIETAEEKEYYPLSSAQRRLFVLQRLSENGTAYNMPGIMNLEGHIDKVKFEKCFRKIIERHASFRTSFEIVEEEPVQKIQHNTAFTIEDHPPAPSPLALISRFIRPFDLSRAPLFRVGLAPGDNGTFLLMVDMHHIISDGYSIDLLIKELMALYGGDEPPPIKIQYKDFACRQHELLETGKLEPRETYWLKQFYSRPPVLDMPTDFERGAVQHFEGETLRFHLDEAVTAGLYTLSSGTGTTLFMLLLAVYNIVLSKYTGREDIVIGSPIAGRNHSDVENVIGLFMETLALRNFPGGGKTFETFLNELKANTLGAYENQDYPFRELMKRVADENDLSRNPLFDAMLIVQNIEMTELAMDGLRITPLKFETGTAKVDITLEAEEKEGKIDLHLEYCTTLFKRETMERFFHHFLNCIKTVIANPRLEISHLDIMDEAEKRQILEDFNDTTGEYSGDQLIHECFEEQVRRTPGAIAVNMSHGTYTTHLTYKELDRKAGDLAYLLREKGVQPGTITAIMMEPSIEMITGLIGILKSGGAYLPMDPDYPRERIDYILKDSNAKIVIDDSWRDVICGGRIDRGRDKSRPYRNRSLAYIIYTSGSSGRPKGVLVEHRNLCGYINAFHREFDIRSTDVVLQQASVCFDTFGEEVYPVLSRGGRIAVPRKDEVRDITLLSRFILRHNVSIVDCSPLLLNELNRVDFGTTVHTFISGGDVLKAEYIDQLVKRGTVYNTYGPTETTICAGYYKCTGTPGSVIPIGTPIANYRLYIRDKYDMLVPVGVPGELSISGIGVARGYLNNPELTAERFSRGAAPSNSLTPYYRTGDLARWLPDGNIEFLGRIDRQVKIRGFRIEQGEIENQLLNFDGIKDAVVIAREEQPGGDRYLCVYIVSTGDIETPRLREYLSRKLPDYMIPSFFVPMDSFPLTTSGKVDRGALPGPEIIAGKEYVPPGNEIEEKLAGIWADVLNIKRRADIGIDDNFFHLGGHSLKAVAVVSKVQESFNIKIPLAEIFRHPTIRALGKNIETGERGNTGSIFIENTEEREYYPLSSAQKRLYLLYRMDTHSTVYNMPAALTLKGALEKETLRQTFNRLIQRHEGLRTSFISIDEEPVQRVRRRVDFEVRHYQRDGIRQFVNPFDLSRAPLLRAGLIEKSAGEYILLVDMHHIVSDGTSMGVFIREFMTLYDGRQLEDLKIQYKDFTMWQNNRTHMEEIRKQEIYWLRVFKDEAPLLAMPTDFPRPPTRDFAGDSITFGTGSTLAGRLKDLARAEGTTLFIVLLAAYNVLLFHYTGQQDIVVGAPAAGRPHPDLNHVVGMFANTLALRNYPFHNNTFANFLKSVNQKTLEAFENQDYQFEMLVEKINVPRDAGRNPLFDTMFALQNMDMPEMKLKNLELTPYPLESNVSHFDFLLEGSETNGDVFFFLEYGTQLFERATMEKLGDHFVNILKEIVEDPGIALSAIDMLSEVEKEKIVVFNESREEESYDFE